MTKPRECPHCGAELRHANLQGDVWFHPGARYRGECLNEGRGFRKDDLRLWNMRAKP